MLLGFTNKAFVSIQNLFRFHPDKAGIVTGRQMVIFVSGQCRCVKSAAVELPLLAVQQVVKPIIP